MGRRGTPAKNLPSEFGRIICHGSSEVVKSYLTHGGVRIIGPGPYLSANKRRGRELKSFLAS